MAQAAPLVVGAPVPPPVITPEIDIRRFQVPDIDHHGGWLLKRFTTAYPHISERQLPGWLRGIVYNNEYLFLFQENSCALAQLMRPDPFTPRNVVVERFVWARNPLDKSHVMEAALFYDRFKTWAGHCDAAQIVVGEQSDVPPELIGRQLGKLLERREMYVRL